MLETLIITKYWYVSFPSRMIWSVFQRLGFFSHFLQMFPMSLVHCYVILLKSFQSYISATLRGLTSHLVVLPVFTAHSLKFSV